MDANYTRFVHNSELVALIKLSFAFGIFLPKPNKNPRQLGREFTKNDLLDDQAATGDCAFSLGQLIQIDIDNFEAFLLDLFLRLWERSGVDNYILNRQAVCSKRFG